jgi:hypothetical protein
MEKTKSSLLNHLKKVCTSSRIAKKYNNYVDISLNIYIICLITGIK